MKKLFFILFLFSKIIADDMCFIQNISKTAIMNFITKGESGNDPNALNWTLCLDKQGNFVRYGSTIASCENSGLVYKIQASYMKKFYIPKTKEQEKGYLSSATVGEVKRLQSQNIYFAVGLYQMIPGTFSNAVNLIKKFYPDIESRTFNAETQAIVMAGMFFDGSLRNTRKYLMCGDDNLLEASAREIAKQWGVAIKPGTKNGRGIEATNECLGYYEGNGVDRCHTPYSSVLNGIKSAKNTMISAGCADCKMEDVKEPEPNNPPPGKEAKPAKKLQEYTPTAREDVKYKSKARKPTASYKRNASPQCYCNKS